MMYRLISLGAVLGAMFLFFGALPAFLLAWGIEPRVILSVVIVGIGVCMLLLSVEGVGALFANVVKKPGALELGWRLRDPMPPRIVGLGLLAGGLAYARTGRVDSVVAGLSAAAIVLAIRLARARREAAKQIREANPHGMN